MCNFLTQLMKHQLDSFPQYMDTRTCCLQEQGVKLYWPSIHCGSYREQVSVIFIKRSVYWGRWMWYFALGQEGLVKTLVFLGCSWGTRRVQHALLTIRIAEISQHTDKSNIINLERPWMQWAYCAWCAIQDTCSLVWVFYFIFTYIDNNGEKRPKLASVFVQLFTCPYV